MSTHFRVARSIARYANAAVCLVGGAAGTAETSPDGVTWTAQTTGFGSANISGVAYSPSLQQFVAVGTGGVLQTSPDAVTWTTRTTPFSVTITGTPARSRRSASRLACVDLPTPSPPSNVMNFPRFMGLVSSFGGLI